MRRTSYAWLSFVLACTSTPPGQVSRPVMSFAASGTAAPVDSITLQPGQRVVVLAARAVPESVITPPPDTTVTPPPPPPPPPPSPPAVERGIGFGPFNATPGGLGSQFINSNTPGNLKTQLVAAEVSGGYCIFAAPTGGAHTAYFTNGKFDVVKWRAKIEAYRADSATWRRAVQKRTLCGVSVSDEPDGDTWGGTPIPWSVVDQMACTAAGIFKGTTIYVRADVTSLPTSHNCLGGGMVQYSARKGPVAAFAAAQSAAAKAKDYVYLAGVNYDNGGAVVAGCHQSVSRAGACSMSGVELTTNVKALAADSSRVCGMTGWGPNAARYTTYTGYADVKAAVTGLVAWGKTRPRPARCG